jgi:uncharacterized protein with HEPN domain
MSERNWKLYIEDILESIELIERYIDNMQFDNFKNDRKTQDAVIRNFEIIGEASRLIPEDLRNKYKDIDWQGIIGLRNRIVHEYFGINKKIIWHIITKELPSLKEKMSQIFESSEN